MVVKECEMRSFMTNRFSKRGIRKFRQWFIRKGKKHFGWTRSESLEHWDRFIKSHKIEIKND